MSGLTGKKSSTLKKEQVKESKLLTTGVKNIRFWHEATAGETSIPFGSLVMPSAVAANGYSNPTSTEILSANLALFKDNVDVYSSINQKLMAGLTYVVNNNQVKFVNGYEAVEGEIFEVTYKNDVITGTNVVDARPLTATGTLLAGQTEFNVGEAFKTNAYPNQQIGEVIVILDGQIQMRNVGNATAAPSADGNYQEVHSTGGFGTVIKFNDSFGTDKSIVVISRNLISERPDISMMQLIESLGAQLDKVIEYVAQDLGVPESTFQAAPNQIDLKAFGDKVYQNIVDITDLQNSKQDVFSIKYQTKFLSSDISNSTQDVADLQFNNLVIGKKYRISGLIAVSASATSDSVVTIRDASGGAGNVIGSFGTSNFTGTTAGSLRAGVDEVFTAQTSQIFVRTIHAGGNAYLRGGSNRDTTHLTLEELPFHTPTTDWT